MNCVAKQELEFGDASLIESVAGGFESVMEGAV